MGSAIGKIILGNDIGHITVCIDVSDSAILQVGDISVGVAIDGDTDGKIKTGGGGVAIGVPWVTRGAHKGGDLTKSSLTERNPAYRVITRVRDQKIVLGLIVGDPLWVEKGG